MPGPTETEFFSRADMEDTKIGQADKDDARDVARDGYEAMMAGRASVVAGSFKNRIQAEASARTCPTRWPRRSWLARPSLRTDAASG